MDFRLPWGQFFDLPSLQKFAPVIEFLDFLDMQPGGVIDHVYVLQHFEKLFMTGVFENDIQIQECSQPLNYKKLVFHNFLLGFKKQFF